MLAVDARPVWDTFYEATTVGMLMGGNPNGTTEIEKWACYKAFEQ